MLVPQINNTQEYLDFVLQQYKDNPDSNFLKILTEFLNRGNTIEEVIWEVYRLGIDRKQDTRTATGYYLDLFGKLVNTTRDGDTDTEYLERIQETIASRRSGTPEDIYSLILEFIPEGEGEAYLEMLFEYPAGYVIATNRVISRRFIDSATVAGVGAYIGGRILLDDGTGNCFLLLDDTSGQVRASEVPLHFTDGREWKLASGRTLHRAIQPSGNAVNYLIQTADG